MTSALAFSASIMCSTQLNLLVFLACFPTRLRVRIYMLSTYVAGFSRSPWGNQGELLRPTSKPTSVFSGFLSSPALTSSRLANEPARSYFCEPVSYFSSFLLSYFHLLTTLKVSSAPLAMENTPSQRVPSGRVLRPSLAPRGASCSGLALVPLSASHLCLN